MSPHSRVDDYIYYHSQKFRVPAGWLRSRRCSLTAYLGKVLFLVWIANGFLK